MTTERKLTDIELHGKLEELRREARYWCPKCKKCQAKKIGDNLGEDDDFDYEDIVEYFKCQNCGASIGLEYEWDGYGYYPEMYLIVDEEE